MQRYWDLSEKERSELLREDVDAMLRVELMEKGVLKVEPPQLQPVEQVETELTTYYGIKHGSYSSDFDDFVFLTAEDAAAFIKIPMLKRNSGYGVSVNHVTAYTEPFAVQEVRLASQQEFLRVKQAADKAKAASDANKKMTDAYNADCAKIQKATSGVWEDWQDCRAKAHRMQKVIDTRKEYVGICDGDHRKADKFLVKVFEPEEIADAFAWFGITPPEPPAELAHNASELQPVAAAAADEF